ncbi:hypothetical protein BT96DRAFT_1015708 [Gymnopus androsaceus JB14]|uniref:Uncharacterized protein n=1 Tax=Gymnopus androsaceus JB14 TaxID=1447944 RepID=A0A6A4I416_9AGAR|nr:hypothetical protein BT96DRAFT_1015708 [Gymnopus androsaceus JB14]
MIYPRPSPFFFLFILGLCLLNFRLAAAELYPTRPVASTVYRTQHCDPVTWIDDGKNPSMQNMGQLTVDLYCENENDYYVLTIGQADPLGQTLMFCPPRDFPWPDCDHRYKLLFNGTDGKKPIETHNFQIIGTHPNGGRTITIAPTSTSASAASTATSNQRPQGYDTSSTTVYADPLPYGSSGKKGSDAHRNSASSSRGVDMEKMKFRFVFIVWPALIGISMAL